MQNLTWNTAGSLRYHIFTPTGRIHISELGKLSDLCRMWAALPRDEQPTAKVCLNNSTTLDSGAIAELASREDFPYRRSAI